MAGARGADSGAGPERPDPGAWQVEGELGGEVLIRAAGFHGDAVIGLVAVARRAPARIVLPLVQDSDGAWRVDETIREQPLIDALAAAWDECGSIEVIGTDLRGPGD